jgi:hypothetical protein
VVQGLKVHGHRIQQVQFQILASLYEIVQVLEIDKEVGDNMEKVMMPEELYMRPTENLL